jgi:preprotein translocase subunit YajC
MTTVLTQMAQLVAAQAQGGQPAGGMLESFGGLLPLILMFGVIYMLLIRPASKQRKEHAELLNRLKKDDEVVTNGGIYGKVIALEDNVATLEISDKVKIRIMRDRIAGLWNPQAPARK